MEGISKYSRLRITAVAALVAAGLVLMAVSASANATCVNVFCAKDVSVGIRNSSKTAIMVQICPRGHVSNPGDTGANPCSVVTETYIIGANGQRKTIFNTNPLGIIITPYYPFGTGPAQDKTSYFYASNPLIGLPFFRAQGHKIALKEHETVLRHVDGVHVGFHRYGDEDRDGQSVKVMRIEIRKWPGAV